MSLHLSLVKDDSCDNNGDDNDYGDNDDDDEDSDDDDNYDDYLPVQYHSLICIEQALYSSSTIALHIC